MKRSNKMSKRHPIQPLELDKYGTLRFKENAIVNYLLDKAPVNMNDIACEPFSQEDREQFAQLIGYSLSGSGDLSYMSDETYETAEKMYKGGDERDARIQYLEETLQTVREHTKQIASTLFRIHPDDLEV